MGLHIENKRNDVDLERREVEESGGTLMTQNLALAMRIFQKKILMEKMKMVLKIFQKKMEKMKTVLKKNLSSTIKFLMQRICVKNIIVVLMQVLVFFYPKEMAPLHVL